MCGPLVLMLGRHRYKYFYFLGRLCSFALAGMLAGELGAVANIVLSQYHLSALTSLAFGAGILMIGVMSLMGKRLPEFPFLHSLNHYTTSLILRDRKWPTFLFGFFTVALPCGQTLIVFSACALSGSPWIGFWNGLALGLLTSPSLFLAMNAHQVFKNMKAYYMTVVGVCGIVVGTLAICRGIAELELIPHLVLNQRYHIVLY